MRVGFTGTQDGMTSKQREAVAVLLRNQTWRPMRFHHGDCVGADAEAHDIVAALLETFIEAHPCTIREKRAFKYANVVNEEKPPLVRNRIIVNSSEVLIVAPRTKYKVLRSGTWSTYRYARQLGKPTYLVYSDGSVLREGPWL